MENFYCWIRSKEEKTKSNEEQKDKIYKTKQDLCCSGCFKHINSLDEYSQITKIKNKYFGICSDECYKIWLRMPATQHLAPINDYVTLSRLHDNQQ